MRKLKLQKFKVKEKRNLLDRFIFWLSRKIKSHPKIINLNDGPMPEKYIILGNHNGAGGPFSYRAFLPFENYKFMSWGAYQMLENYFSRRRYLYKTFYVQKLHYGRIRSFIFSMLFATVSKTLYKMAGVLPVYYDTRVKYTLQYSMDCIEKNIPVLIFPEDAETGYKDYIERFFSGFITLSKVHYAKYGTDLPIFTAVYVRNPAKAKRKNKYKKIVIGKPMYLRELMQTRTRDEAAEAFRAYMNELYTEHNYK
ncbi:MAG: hypothetical protein LBS99_03805 [Clostridiales bacterium]|nr:hypothetical protein [Clostridiales bacterium]